MVVGTARRALPAFQAAAQALAGGANQPSRQCKSAWSIWPYCADGSRASALYQAFNYYHDAERCRRVPGSKCANAGRAPLLALVFWICQPPLKAIKASASCCTRVHPDKRWFPEPRPAPLLLCRAWAYHHFLLQCKLQVDGHRHSKLAVPSLRERHDGSPAPFRESDSFVSCGQKRWSASVMRCRRLSPRCASSQRPAAGSAQASCRASGRPGVIDRCPLLAKGTIFRAATALIVVDGDPAQRRAAACWRAQFSGDRAGRRACRTARRA